MLVRIHDLLQLHPDREAFFSVVSRHYPRTSCEYMLIEKAYDLGKDAFRHKYRDDGIERYFEHLRRVTLILMLHLRCTDYEMIIAALLHDIIEDIDGWNEQRIAIEFTPRVAQLVWWVTKPSVALFGGSKEARNRAYHARLHNAPRDAIMIKLADRLDNMMTLWKTAKAKQLRKVRETQDFYLILAELHCILIHELEATIDVVLEELNKS